MVQESLQVNSAGRLSAIVAIFDFNSFPRFDERVSTVGELDFRKQNDHCSCAYCYTFAKSFGVSGFLDVMYDRQQFGFVHADADMLHSMSCLRVVLDSLRIT